MLPFPVGLHCGLVNMNMYVSEHGDHTCIMISIDADIESRSGVAPPWLQQLPRNQKKK